MKNKKIISIYAICFLVISISVFNVEPVECTVLGSQTLQYTYPSANFTGSIMPFTATQDNGFIMQLNWSQASTTDGFTARFVSYPSATNHSDYVFFTFACDYTSDKFYLFYGIINQYADWSTISSYDNMLSYSFDVVNASDSVLFNINTNAGIAELLHLEGSAYTSLGWIALDENVGSYFHLLYVQQVAREDWTNGDNGLYTYTLSDDIDDFTLSTINVRFTDFDSNGEVYVDIFDVSGEMIFNRYNVNASAYDFYFPTGYYYRIYGVADEGYYFNSTEFFTSDPYDYNYFLFSGYIFTPDKDTYVRVSFDILPDGIPQNVDLVVNSPHGNAITVSINGEITSLTSEYYGWSRFSVPQNTLVYFEYVDLGDSYEFYQWNYIYNYQGFLYNGSSSSSNSDNPFELNFQCTIGEYYYWYTAVTVSIQELWTGEGSEPTLPPLTPTAEPSTTYNPSVTPPAYGVVHTILEFLFGDSGLLGTGFGILIIFLIMLPCIIFEQLRNIYGFVLFFNLGAVLVIATSLIGLWLLIVVVLVDVIIVVMRSGILNNTNGVS